MNLKSRIEADMKAAMRARHGLRLETIRLLRAAVQRREVDDRVALDDQGVLTVVQKLVKQGSDAMEQFQSGGREDLARKEREQVDILRSYLPEPLDQRALNRLIQEAIDRSGARTLRDMGKVMAALKSEIQGRADMAAVSAKVKQFLS